MKIIYLFFAFLLFCCSGKIEKNASKPSEALSPVKKIHLFRINGLVDMSKPLAVQYFSILPDKIFHISELRKPDGSLLKSDTLKTLNRNSRSLLNYAGNLLKEPENNELDNDGSHWGFTLFYNAEERNFSYRNDEPLHPTVAKIYRLLTILEKQ